MKLKLILISAIALATSCKTPKVVTETKTTAATATAAENNWEFLLDENLSKWDTFIGVPHYSVELEGFEKGDGKKGTPVGLNNDPLKVFSAKEIDGETVLNITGEIYGGLSTKKEYGNYHLSMEFKWGTKQYEPRLKSKKDSGILYHAQEPHGAFWNVWMRAPEMQVQVGDCGDFFPLAGVGADVRAKRITEADGKNYWIYDPKGEVITFKSGGKGRCKKGNNYENAVDQWNTLELICIGDKAYHIVNGKIVMVLENSIQFDKDEAPVSLTKGKIQIQSEAAEVFYKNIKIKSVTTLPQAIAKQLL